MTDTNDSHRVEGGELRQFVSTIERLQSEKADIAELEKEQFASAKAAGYEAPIIRTVLKRRKMERDALAELDAKVSMYEDALG